MTMKRWPRGAPDDEHGHGQGGRFRGLHDWAGRISDRLPGGEHRAIDRMLRDLSELGGDGEEGFREAVESTRKTLIRTRGHYTGAIPANVGVLLELSDLVSDGSWRVSGWMPGGGGIIRRVFAGGPGAGSIRIETDRGNLDFAPKRHPFDPGAEIRIESAILD